jgi:hypothetical protein
MNKIHETKDGERMYISQMSDDYLVKHIGKIIEKFEVNKNMLNSKVEVNSLRSAVYKINPKIVKEQAEHMIDALINALAYYVLEAALRKLDVSKLLQKAFERKGPEEKFEVQGLDGFLTVNEKIEYDEEE